MLIFTHCYNGNHRACPQVLPMAGNATCTCICHTSRILKKLMSNYDDICHELDKVFELILEASNYIDDEGLHDIADELIQIASKVHGFLETFRDNY